VFALVDCNNFFASCERVFNPAMESRPVVVLSNNDGCVIARSNEAKLLGIKMGEPAFKIKEILYKNNVAVFSTNYTLYGDMSERVMNTLKGFTDNIEIYSIDEAFLDLNDMKYEDIYEYSVHIRNTVRKWTGIPVSIGIASTKTLAKVANKIAKKNRSGPGVYYLKDENQIEEALQNLDVEDIWGVGRQYAKLLKMNDITTALKLRNADDTWIKKNLTIMGMKMVNELRGMPCIPMELVRPDKQGILTSRSFGTPVEDIAHLKEAVATFTVRCAEKLRKQHSCAHFLLVFIHTDRFKPSDPQYRNFKLMQLEVPTNNPLEMVKYSLQGLEIIYKTGYKYKKAGVYLSGIVPDNEIQASLFDKMDRTKFAEAMKSVDIINGIMGRDKVRLAVQGFDRKWKLRQERLSPNYTSNWREILTINI
jgi:DNA polymerase V